jgi:thiosulfate dehydrogenase (quinone) large subunit
MAAQRTAAKRPLRPPQRAVTQLQWAEPVRPWWALLPLRAFLGFTFTFAGLQKLANPAYLDGHSPQSVQAMILGLRHQSPIGFLLGASAHAPTLVGLLIAFGELCVGLATLLGLWSRLAAVGGALLAFTFFLTVSWHTRPYYYGSDIVFLAAWTVPIALGTWGRPSLDDVIARRAAADADPQRRSLVLAGAAAGALGVAAALTGGIVAAIGRSLHSDSGAATAPPPLSSPSPQPTHPKPGSHTSTPAGRVIARTADLPTGAATSFDDDTGAPALLVHEPRGDFRAFRAVCTHAGCTVQYDPGHGAFICPCHGGVYDAATGSVLSGPPPSPLPQLNVDVSGGEVRLV